MPIQTQFPIGYFNARNSSRFSLETLSGLQLLLDSSDATTLFQDDAATTPATTNSAPVGGWRDKSANAFIGTQSTVGAKPTLLLNQQNGLPGVSYDGGDFLSFGQPAALDFVGGTASFTYGAVLKLGATPGGTLFSKARNGARQYLFSISTADRTANVQIGPTNVTGTRSLSNITAIIIYVVTSTSVKCWVNGILDIDTTTLSAASATGMDVLSGARRNLNNTDTAFLLTGVVKLKEFIVNRAITDAERVACEALLNTEWAVYEPDGTPHLLIQFDDGLASDYSVAFSEMTSRSLLGTSYVSTDFVDDANYMTAAQLIEMDNAGWAIGNHGRSHTNMASTMNQAQAEAELLGAESALLGFGVSNRATRHVAYPFSSYDAEVLAAMTATGMYTGRTTVTQQFMPTVDRQLIPSFQVARGMSVGTVTAFVDALIAAKRFGIVLFHGLAESPANDYQYSIAEFTAVLDYIVFTGIDTLTIDQLYNQYLTP